MTLNHNLTLMRLTLALVLLLGLVWPGPRVAAGVVVSSEATPPGSDLHGALIDPEVPGATARPVSREVPTPEGPATPVATARPDAPTPDGTTTPAATARPDVPSAVKRPMLPARAARPDVPAQTPRPAASRASASSDSRTQAQAGPDLLGLATWYGDASHRARQTRSGERFDAKALTCAVPDELWPALTGRTLLVQSADGQREVIVRVNDSGYLSEAGRFVWEVRTVGELDVGRWWPSPDGLTIVVDLTPAAHKLLSPDGETAQVCVWVLPGSPSS